MKDEELRDRIWQILHNHKKEDEWATVVFEIFALIKETLFVDRCPACGFPPPFGTGCPIDSHYGTHTKEIK